MASTHRETLAQAQRRRFLARRRCLRALRRTVAFLVLVTPFLYYGYVLCCHMPSPWRLVLPRGIELCEGVLFISNLYVLFMYLQSAPVLAPLPLAVNILFVFLWFATPYEDINQRTYFEQFRQDRMAVVALIKEGTLGGSDGEQGVARLPMQYKHVSFSNYGIPYGKNEKGISVFFSTNWTQRFADEGFLYCSDAMPENWDPAHSIRTTEKRTRFWSYVVLDFTCREGDARGAACPVQASVAASSLQ